MAETALVRLASFRHGVATCLCPRCKSIGRARSEDASTPEEYTLSDRSVAFPFVLTGKLPEELVAHVEGCKCWGACCWMSDPVKLPRGMSCTEGLVCALSSRNESSGIDSRLRGEGTPLESWSGSIGTGGREPVDRLRDFWDGN